MQASRRGRGHSVSVTMETPHGMLFRRTCPICGGADVSCAETIPGSHVLRHKQYLLSAEDEIWLQSQTFRILQCRPCRFYFQEAIPNDAFSGRLYSSWISSEESLQKKQRILTHLVGAHLRTYLRFLQLIRKPPEKIAVMEGGCGWGYFLELGQRLGVRVEGIETNAIRVAECRRRGLAVWDVREFDFSGNAGRFDAVVMFQVLEHLREPRQVLSQYSSLLCDGGLFAVEVPNCRRLRALVRKERFKYYQPLEHLSCFTPYALDRLFAMCDLRRVRKPLVVVADSVREVAVQCAASLPWVGEATTNAIYRKLGSA